PFRSHAREKSFACGEDDPVHYLVPCDTALHVACPFAARDVGLSTDYEKSIPVSSEVRIFQHDPGLSRRRRSRTDIEDDHLTGEVRQLLFIAHFARPPRPPAAPPSTPSAATPCRLSATASP